jgi:hypothetical protein
VVSEYYKKKGYLTFSNISYKAITPGKKQVGWQEFDLLAVKDGKGKIISCKRGLRPAEYDRQAELLSFHKQSLMKNPQLKRYRSLIKGEPELLLIIEYPRPRHIERMKGKGLVTKPLDDILRDFVKMLEKELAESGGKEGKENNYATRLLKGLLSKKIIKSV